MKYPTLSIVIPCYNEEKLIANNFKHILNQSVLPEEVIFVDNNSTDNSLTVAQSFSEEFKNKGIKFRVLEEKRQSQIFARALGYGQAQSELIGSLDTDSLIAKDWVKTAKEYFVKNKTTVLIGGPFYFYNLFFIFNIYFFFVFLGFRLLPGNYEMWGGNSVFKKQAYQRIGGLDKCDKMVKDLKLNLASDDAFISDKIKLIGNIKFVWGLKAKGEWRGKFIRNWKQQMNSYKIKKYIKDNYKYLKK